METKESVLTDHNDLAIEKKVCSANADSVAVIKSMVNRRIQSVIGYRSSIVVECSDNVVTLNGHFASQQDKQRALRAAITNPCVSGVVNNATVSDSICKN